MNKEEILKKLAEATISGDVEMAVDYARKAIEVGIDAYEAIINGCVEGM